MLGLYVSSHPLDGAEQLEAPVHMSVTRPGRTGQMLLNLAAFSVEPGSSFMAEVKSLLGFSAPRLLGCDPVTQLPARGGKPHP